MALKKSLQRELDLMQIRMPVKKKHTQNTKGIRR
jgi:hypothetical protein